MFSVLQKIYYSDELSRAGQTIYKSDDLNLLGEFSGSLEGLMVQVQFRDVTVCHTDQGLNPGVLWIWSLIVFDKEVLVTVPGHWDTKHTSLLVSPAVFCYTQLAGLILTILMEISADTGSLLSGFDFPECLFFFQLVVFHFLFSFKLDYHVDL